MRKTFVLGCFGAFALALVGCDGPDGDGGPSSSYFSLMEAGGGFSYGQAYDYEASSNGDDGFGWFGFTEEDRFGEPLTLSDGELSSDYGGVAIPSRIPASAEGWDEGGWSTIEVMADGQGGVAMALFEVWGDLEELESQGGAVQSFSLEDNSDGVFVSITGCAGPSAYNWDYDQPAENVLIRVEEDPDDASVRTYDFVATFGETETDQGWGSTEGTALSGSFTVVH